MGKFGDKELCRLMGDETVMFNRGENQYPSPLSSTLSNVDAHPTHFPQILEISSAKYPER